MTDDLAGHLRRIADEEAHGYATAERDLADDLSTLTRGVQRRRAVRLTASLGAAAAGVLAVAVAAAALTGQTPRPPAVVSPAPSATPSASPTPSLGATIAPTETPSAVDVATTDAATRGVLTAYASPPTASWTVRAADLVPGWAGDSPPVFLDIRKTVYASGGDVTAQGIDAGSTWVVAVGSATETVIVGIDETTGSRLWTLGEADPTADRTLSCVGVDTQGHVVCLGFGSGSAAAQLVDPATGRIVRSVPVHPGTIALGLTGDVVISALSPSAGVVGWEVTDLVSQEVLSSHVAPDPQVVEYSGDGVSQVWMLGTTASLFVPTTGFVTVDTMTGEAVGPSPADDPRGVVVWRPATSDLPGFRTSARDDGSVQLEAVSTVDGSTLWTHGGELAGVVDDGVVLVDRASTVLVDLRTGATRWSVPQSGSLVATDGSRLVRTTDSGIDAVDLATGGTAWTLPSGSGRATVVGNELALWRAVGTSSDATELTRLAP